MRLPFWTDKRVHHLLWTAVLAILWTASALGLRPALSAEQIPAATDAPKPLTPEESRKRFRLPEGFRIGASWVTSATARGWPANIYQS